MIKRFGAATLAVTVMLAFPMLALARGGFGGGMHGGGFRGGGGGGGGYRGGGGAAPRMAAPRMAEPAFHGGPAGGFRGGAGNVTSFNHGPSLNYSRGYSGLNAGGARGGLGATNNAAVTHNFGMATQSSFGNRTAVGNRVTGIGGNTINNRNVVNNVGMNNASNWHRGYWNGHWGGYGGNWGNNGRNGFGGYGGYGGYGLGYGGFGSGLGFGLGTGLGMGLGYGLLGGYGMGGYGMGGYGMGGYGMGGYGMGGYGMGGYGGYGMGGYGMPSWGYGNWPYTSGYSSYMNPYYASNTGDGNFNYAQPIAVDSAAPDQGAIDAGTASFAAARESFKAGDYAAAQRQVDEALTKLPNDVDLHEFRALTLFAQGRYSEASAALYAVLTAGPGWNWATLVGLYPNVDIFTTQLRALEQYTSANPNAASARFLLAYLYISMGSTDAAVDALRTVVRLQPDDRLSRQLLADLTPSNTTGATSPGTGAAPTAPAPGAAPAAVESTVPPPTDLTGTWKAKGAAGTTIELMLQLDGQFTWTTTSQAAPKTFSGKYTSGAGLITMASSDGLVIVGRLSGTGDGGFHFKLIGGGPGDPGLSFTR